MQFDFNFCNFHLIIIYIDHINYGIYITEVKTKHGCQINSPRWKVVNVDGCLAIGWGSNPQPRPLIDSQVNKPLNHDIPHIIVFSILGSGEFFVYINTKQ